VVLFIPVAAELNPGWKPSPPSVISSFGLEGVTDDDEIGKSVEIEIRVGTGVCREDTRMYSDTASLSVE